MSLAVEASENLNELYWQGNVNYSLLDRIDVSIGFKKNKFQVSNRQLRLTTRANREPAAIYLITNHQRPSEIELIDQRNHVPEADVSQVRRKEKEKFHFIDICYQSVSIIFFPLSRQCEYITNKKKKIKPPPPTSPLPSEKQQKK